MNSRPLTTSEPPSVDWWITSRCNLRCDFCYGPVPATDPVHLREQIARTIAMSPTRVVTFCGGEPLLVPELPAIAEYQRSAGKRTVLNTNGELLRRRFTAPAQLPFDIVGISIDGPDEQTHRQMRGGAANFAETLAAARWLVTGDGPKRKIGSVVSRVNVDRLPDLARLVRELAPDVWRIYQYSPWGPQNHGQNRHSLFGAEFEAALAAIIGLCAPVPVRWSSVSMTGGCLIVDPHGRVLREHDGAYAVMGNCLEETLEEIWGRSPQTVVRDNKRWLDLVDRKG